MAAKKAEEKTVVFMGKKIKKADPDSRHEISGIIVIAVSVMLMFACYWQDSIGAFGGFLRSVLLGMLGFPVFLALPVLLLFGVSLLFRQSLSGFRRKATLMFLLLLIISGFFHMAFYTAGKYSEMSFFGMLGNFYSESEKFAGGGLLGGMIAQPLISSLNIIGTLIVLITLALIDIIFLTEISIVSLFRRRDDEAGTGQARTRAAAASVRTDVPVSAATAADGSKPKWRKRFNFSFNPNEYPGHPHETTDDVLNEDVFQKALEEEQSKADDASPTHAPIHAPAEARQAGIDSLAVHDEIAKTAKATAATGAHTYEFPPLSLLTSPADDRKIQRSNTASAADGARKLEETLYSFGVEAKVIKVSPGPSVTRYELQPSHGVKVSQVVKLVDDIALNLASAGVRIEAPIPGKAAIGIEVANKESTTVHLKDVLSSDEFKNHPSKIAIALGKDISGESIVANIANMPHLLIAGATGSGKSVCLNSLIISLLYKASPDEVKLMMVDPKVVELGIYNGIPHLLMPVVTDPKKAAGALNWAVEEMLSRYKKFADKGVRDLKGYNSYAEMEDDVEKMQQIVIIIDELADLMMVAPNEVETSIARLAQMARAAGIHLIIATQRPSVDVITGIIKANIPSRIAFAVSSLYDSKTILDITGAERLLGRGDMLYYPVGRSKPARVQGAFVTDSDVNRVVDFVKAQAETVYNAEAIERINNGPEQKDHAQNAADDLLPRAIEVVVEAGQASSSYISRKLEVGYPRAARLLDQMEERGIIGRANGSKPREVLITKEQLQEMQMRSGT